MTLRHVSNFIQPELQFASALADSGIPCSEPIVADGTLHRFRTSDDHSENCWYVLHADSPQAGAFGCWKRGISETWCAFNREALSEVEHQKRREQVANAQAQRVREEAKRHEAAQSRAAEIWTGAKPADDHPYLTKKGIKPHGARQHGNALVVPLRAGGELHSLQFIKPDGEKRFLSGGRVAGCYFSIGSTQDASVLCVVEGFATGASIHEATGHPVAVVFNSGNLLSVAQALRAKFPDLRIVICADNDAWTEGNPGLAKAREAAEAVGGLLVGPQFADCTTRPTDFNDLARLEGMDAVCRCIDRALITSATPTSPPPGTMDSAGVEFRCLADVEAKTINWLWPGKIARGKVTMLAGNPGLGKSQVTASMAAIVTTGGQWPVDRRRCAPGNVVFLSAEDDAADTIKPRLMAAGADLNRVFILDAVVDGFDPQGKSIPRQFDLRKDIARLGELLAKIGDVALISIDPVTAYLGDTDSHRNAEVRALLAPLGELAARHGAAVVCVSHLNKSGSSDALMRVTGSLAFVAAARAAFIVARDPEDDTRRLFLPAKNNIGKDETGLSFTIESATVGQGIETSRIVWGSEAVSTRADDALALGSAEDRSELQDAVGWLRNLLAEGPLSAKDVNRQAEQTGFSSRTIRRAKDNLAIKPTKTRFDGGWEWCLPPKVAKSAEDGQEKMLDTFGEFGHLRKAEGS